MKKPATSASSRALKCDANVEGDARLRCLLDISAEVFMAVGYEAASVGEIARRVKASKQTIYARFSTKADLFQAAITWRADATFHHLSGQFVAHDPPRKALTAFGTVLLEMVLDARAVGILRLVYMESGRFPQLGEVLYDRGAGRCFRLLENYIAEQRKLGTLSVTHMSIAAEQFMDMITGKLLMRAALGVAPNPPARDRKLRVRAAVDVFLAAYGASSR